MQRQKLIRWALGLIGLTLLAVVWQWPDNRLKVIGCSVGQGDAAIVMQGFNQVLVDSGPANQQILSCLGKYLPFWDRRIEMVIVSHPEADHIGSLPAVLERYQVGLLVVPNVAKETDLFRAVWRIVHERGIKVATAQQGQVLRLGEMEWQILWPELSQGAVLVWADTAKTPVLGTTTNEASVNNESVVAEVRFRQFEALFTGDAPAKVEDELLMRGLVRQVEVVKVSHHGSNTGSSLDFVKGTAPKAALIEVGKGNRYGHPVKSILDRWQGVGAVVYRTDTQGDVRLVSDGQNEIVAVY